MAIKPLDVSAPLACANQLDPARRQLLKMAGLAGVAGIAAGSIAPAVAGTAGGAFADHGENLNTAAADASAGVDRNLAHIHVHTRVSALSNDLEIVFTNAGTETTTISSITPAVISMPRGEFRLQELHAGGGRVLAVGESASLPIRRHAVVLNGTSMVDRQVSLARQLAGKLSIVTDGDAFAAVSIVNPAAQLL